MTCIIKKKRDKHKNGESGLKRQTVRHVGTGSCNRIPADFFNGCAGVRACAYSGKKSHTRPIFKKNIDSKVRGSTSCLFH